MVCLDFWVYVLAIVGVDCFGYLLRICFFCRWLDLTTLWFLLNFIWVCILCALLLGCVCVVWVVGLFVFEVFVVFVFPDCLCINDLLLIVDLLIYVGFLGFWRQFVVLDFACVFVWLWFCELLFVVNVGCVLLVLCVGCCFVCLRNFICWCGYVLCLTCFWIRIAISHWCALNFSLILICWFVVIKWLRVLLIWFDFVYFRLCFIRLL